MGSLVRVGKHVRFVSLQNYISQSVRNASYGNVSPWFRDNKPGPYPETEEEKIAAAKKYGLLREEYEPYPNDGNGCGDYPMFPPTSVEERDPYEVWTDPFHKRNHGELIHVDQPFYTYSRITHERFKVSPLIMLATLISMGAGTLYLVCNSKFKLHEPILEKQVPYTKVHYLFPTENESNAHGGHH